MILLVSGCYLPFSLHMVELEEKKMQDTLVGALSITDRNTPLFYNARDTNASNYTSYGDVLDFIQGGDGDLRRLGVKEGEVVVYGCPPGGGTCLLFMFCFKCNNTLFLSDGLRYFFYQCLQGLFLLSFFSL
jgi:hypothetical protein